MAQHLPKIFNDPIHGSIELHPYLVRIIDTPQFQRLRNIKQMGGVYFVYPGASHNRFEHSIGVAHLARKMVEALNEKHQGLITDDESLCVQIAALCHDLGHGPFSHLFDDMFMPKAYIRSLEQLEPNERNERRQQLETLRTWTHELQSNRMLQRLLEKLHERNVPPTNDYIEFDQFMNEHLAFIQALIDEDPEEENPNGVDPRQIRRQKPFLFEIVSNKRTGIDVDKMDYFARDCFYLGIESNFNHNRFLKFARVCDREICMRDKEVGNIYDLFHTRNNIHRKACQHKVVRAIDTMIVDAFLAADTELRISNSVLNLDAYTKMTDEIFQKILKGEGGTRARQILMRITNRDLYKCVLEIRPADPTVSLKEILQDRERWRRENPHAETENCIFVQEEIAALVQYLNNDHTVVQELSGRNLHITEMDMKIIDMMYGMKGRNPIRDMRFYAKSNPRRARYIKRHEVSRLLPKVFAEQLIHVYCKRENLTSEAIRILEEKSRMWMDERRYMQG